MTIGTVILAAGESARMGTPKQMLTFRGTTLLERALDNALSLAGAPVVLVLGANAGQVRPTILDPRVQIAENPEWQAGMGTSLRTGLKALLEKHSEMDAVLFLVCDQPLLSPAILGELAATHARTKASIVACHYNGILGVPALFARPLFPELLALCGARGARDVIRAHQHEAVGVAFQDGIIDIDTPADFERLQRAHEHTHSPGANR